MSTHTQGRLRVTHNSWEVSTLHCDGIAVARVHIDSDVDERTQQHLESVKEANASRLAACWNACDALSTEHLEDDAVRKLIQDRDLLLSQRAELLESLKLAYDFMSGSTDRMLLIRAHKAAEAAIAKATGEEK